jgi:hypothetical protein
VKDLARRANKLRRRVYRETAVASASRTAELDHRMAYAEMTAVLDKGRLGVSSTATAVALWRACHERGLRAWCYRFGVSESLTQTVAIVEINGVPQIHDAFFNLSYPCGLYEVLTSLRNGQPVVADREERDRKTYLLDPAREPGGAARWLEEHADRELEPVGGLRRFELLWNPEAFIATHPAIDPALHELTARGYPADLQFAMLHPIAVFDGSQWHREPTEMPLLRGYELGSPTAALHVASRDLERERARLAEQTDAVARLEAELGELKTQFSAASRRFSAEREVWLQQKVGLQAAETALKGELAETRAKLSSAIDLRAQRDSQIAQLRAEIEDTARQSRLQQEALDVLEAEKRDWGAARPQLKAEFRDLHARLAAASREHERLRERSAVLATRVEAADVQVIEITDYLPPLIDEVSRLRRERDAISRECAMLAAKIAASPRERLRSLWRRITKRLPAAN